MVKMPLPPRSATLAEIDGLEAYVSGLLRGDNPYPAQTRERAEWDKGWCEARVRNGN